MGDEANPGVLYGFELTKGKFMQVEMHPNGLLRPVASAKLVLEHGEKSELRMQLPDDYTYVFTAEYRDGLGR